MLMSEVPLCCEAPFADTAGEWAVVPLGPIKPTAIEPADQHPTPSTWQPRHQARNLTFYTWNLPPEIRHPRAEPRKRTSLRRCRGFYRSGFWV